MSAGEGHHAGPNQPERGEVAHQAAESPPVAKGLPSWAVPLRPLVDLMDRVNLGVYAKLLLGCLAGVLLLLGMAVLSLTVIHRMTLDVERLALHQRQKDLAQQMIYAITAQSHYRAMALLTGDSTNNAKIATAKQTFVDNLVELERVAGNDSALLARVREANGRFAEAGSRVLALYQAGDIETALKLHLDEEHKVSHEMESLMRESIADSAEETIEASANFENNRRLLTDIVLGFSGASVALALLFGMVLSLALVRLYEKLRLELGQRTQAEEELGRRAVALESANKELEAFCYSVSHDLRTPLRSIDGFSQALLEDYGEKMDAPGKEYLTRMRSASQRMAQLIDDLLGLSRMTRNKMQVGDVNLSGVASAVASEIKQRQPERQAEFAIAPGVMVKGDAKLLRIALENLLGNAWKFTAKQPQARIEFGVTQHEGKPAYFVRDNGAGFDMTYADKLFGAFQRLHQANEFEGTGIGLATVQRIIHRHGGKVWAEGAVGQGATFYFTL
jgi:signal transduction histidine kinase